MPTGVYIRTEYHRIIISNSKKGCIPWNKNKKGVMPTPWNKGKEWLEMTDENHPLWKGDKIKYSGIHVWLARKFGKADRCENKDCVYPRKDSRGYLMIEPKKFHWSKLKDFKYERRRENFVQLCQSCHHRYDKGNKEISI